MEKNVSTITGLELKQLLILLSTANKTCFRFRQLGEMWARNMMNVIKVHQKTVLLYDEIDTKYYLLRINGIMQFEIDNRFQNYQPYYHYDVKPSTELD